MPVVRQLCFPASPLSASSFFSLFPLSFPLSFPLPSFSYQDVWAVNEPQDLEEDWAMPIGGQHMGYCKCCSDLPPCAPTAP